METRVGRQEAGGTESGMEEAATLPEGGRRMGHQGEEEGAGGGISKERSDQGTGKDEGSGGGRSGARAPSASCSTKATGSSSPLSVCPERGEGEGQPPVPGAASLSALHAQIATLERENRELREAEEAARGREEKGRRETEALQASLLSHSLAGDMAALRKEEEQQARAMEMGKRLVLAEKGCQEAEGLRAQVKELQVGREGGAEGGVEGGLVSSGGYKAFGSVLYFYALTALAPSLGRSGRAASGGRKPGAHGGVLGESPRQAAGSPRREGPAAGGAGTE